MSRKVYRVAIDFDWPMRKVWHGYLMPDRLHENKCPDCKNGYSPRAQYLFDLWYGYVPFHPGDHGLPALTPETPAVRGFAERNVSHSPDFYGAGERAIVREAERLCGLWNGMWCHHITDEDVAALIEAGRLWDFTHSWSRETRWQKIEPSVVATAAQVNEWSLGGFGHDSINASVCVRARCQREGVEDECATCQGHSTIEAYEGQRAEAEAWEPTEPPAGRGWQLWETTSEGSPISPVFGTPVGLERWMVAHGEASSRDVARRFIQAGWAPTGAATPETGPISGVEFVGRSRG